MKQPRERERPEKERKLVLPGAPDRHQLPLGRGVFQRWILHVSWSDWTVNPHSLHKATRASSEFSQKAGVWGQDFSLQSQSVEFRLRLLESCRPGSSDSQAGSGEAGWRMGTQLWFCGAMSRSRTTCSRQHRLPLLRLLWQQFLLLRLSKLTLSRSSHSPA